VGQNGPVTTPPAGRPPSVDALARSLVSTGLPQPLLVDVAREALAAGDPRSAEVRADALRLALLQPVINATGVLLHTNLGRAPVAHSSTGDYQNIELNLATGKRGDRSDHVGRLFARLVGAESALVVNNNAAAVLLTLAALAAGRQAVVSRGEAVEIGGGFRVPDVMAQSGAKLVDVGTTNRTRLADYERALTARGADVALILKVHPSNYIVDGFTQSTSVESLATLGVPVIADIGSGLLDAACPWLQGGPPPWLGTEPAAKQTLAAGAALVLFSGDKLLGGPQAGIIAGRADLVRQCAAHPLARALRPGSLVLGALQEVAMAYLRRDGNQIGFWRMVGVSTDSLRVRAEHLAAQVGAAACAVPTEALPGAGSLPGVTMPSFGIRLDGDFVSVLRSAPKPIIARVRDNATFLDLRTVDPADDAALASALTAALVARSGGATSITRDAVGERLSARLAVGTSGGTDSDVSGDASKKTSSSATASDGRAAPPGA
jgi:L-seryl-tRNA(Ser) seleniumtransferase